MGFFLIVINTEGGKLTNERCIAKELRSRSGNYV